MQMVAALAVSLPSFIRQTLNLHDVLQAERQLPKWVLLSQADQG